MTLEETIAHHRWAAENCVGEVRNEHLQMVGWLSELVRLKAENANCEERYYSLAVENIKLSQLVVHMYRDMQGVLDLSTDTVWVDGVATLRDCMDVYMRVMAELGMPPRDYESRMRELGAEVDE